MYELTNHLSNTLVTISDNKVGVSSSNANLADFYEARVLSATDYYAFGMAMKERSFQSESYRYGFNGQERDRDIDTEGNHNTAEFWEYSAVIGRRWNIDPKIAKHPMQSSYNVCFNNPILYNDPLGDDPPRGWKVIKGQKGGVLVPNSATTSGTNGVVDSFSFGKATFSFNGNGYFNKDGVEYVSPKVRAEMQSSESNKMDIKFTVNGLHTLQVIQLEYSSAITRKKNVVETGQSTNLKVQSDGFLPEKNLVAYPDGADIRLDGRVDGGINSQGYWASQNKEPVAGRPFYNGFPSIDDNITLEDLPFHQEVSQRLAFSSILVIENFYNSGQDVLLGKVSWGFVNYGIQRTHKLHQELTQVKTEDLGKSDYQVLNHYYKEYMKNVATKAETPK